MSGTVGRRLQVDDAGHVSRTARPDDEGGVWRVVVLGIAQDGGRPHVGCRAPCCERARSGAADRHTAACLALTNGERVVLFEATPHLGEQLDLLHELAPRAQPLPERIFLTHAHLGHYTGLLQLGKEAADAEGVVVHATERMTGFLRSNHPWERLYDDGNLVPGPVDSVQIADDVLVEALPVPHRGEHADTVAFRISGPTHAVLFLPDIDRWEDWELDVGREVSRVTVAYLDGTFFGASELPGRDLSRIPHPFMLDTMDRLAGLGGHVHFLHLNHTNPVLDDASPVRERGFDVACPGDVLIL